MIDAFDDDTLFQGVTDDTSADASTGASSAGQGTEQAFGLRVSLAWGAGDLDGVIDQLQGFGVGEAPLRFDELFGDGQDRHALEELLGDSLLSIGPDDAFESGLDATLAGDTSLAGNGVDAGARAVLDSHAPDTSPNESDNAALLAHLLGM
ncbi:hypothetical protein LJC23_03355 [Desulfovibrio sp. OttesenSCG-928-I05]|nr:hypothetical protein [Desulfovibrio sp. OttesenSCG-928-I05]